MTGEGCRAQKLAVELCDLGPVRLLCAHRLGVDGGDRGLERVEAGAAAHEGRPSQRDAFPDRLAVPEAAILVLEQHDLPRVRKPRRPPRIVEEHQREEGARLGRRRHELRDEPGEANRLRAEVVAPELLARGGGVALVEYEVERPQHGVEPFGQVAVRGDAVGDAGAADLSLGAHQALRHRRRRHEERARDLLGRESPEGAERQGDLRLDGERGVAAGEDQPEAVVVRPPLRPRPRTRAARPPRARPSARARRASPRNRASRRRRSIALWRAVDTSHARGFSGTPPPGQRSSAAAKASCMTSSARSKSPTSRMRVARIRPDSAR